MAPKRATRSTRVPPVTPAPNATTTTVTEAQLQALINQGVAAAMAEAEASRILEVQGERPEKDFGSLACIKADEKKLDDIRVVRDFLLSASPVVKSPYRLAPSEMLELLNQLKEASKKASFNLVIAPWEHHAFCQEERRRDENSEEEHEVHLKTILDLLKKENNNAKFFKVRVLVKEFSSYDMWSTGDGLLPRFTRNFSKIVKAPRLIDCPKNKTIWCGGDEQEEDFRILKEKLCNAPVLALPDGPDDFVVYCDASKLAFLRSSPKHNLTSSYGSPSCALVKKYMTSEFAEALTPL
ncbi:putative reverse transcriptase domain-containing protein [Tanacetum coccineum]